MGIGKRRYTAITSKSERLRHFQKTLNTIERNACELTETVPGCRIAIFAVSADAFIDEKLPFMFTFSNLANYGENVGDFVKTCMMRSISKVGHVREYGRNPPRELFEELIDLQNIRKAGESGPYVSLPKREAGYLTRVAKEIPMKFYSTTTNQSTNGSESGKKRSTKSKGFADVPSSNTNAPDQSFTSDSSDGPILDTSKDFSDGGLLVTNTDNLDVASSNLLPPAHSQHSAATLSSRNQYTHADEKVRVPRPPQPPLFSQEDLFALTDPASTQRCYENINAMLSILHSSNSSIPTTTDDVTMVASTTTSTTTTTTTQSIDNSFITQQQQDTQQAQKKKSSSQTKPTKSNTEKRNKKKTTPQDQSNSSAPPVASTKPKKVTAQKRPRDFSSTTTTVSDTSNKHPKIASDSYYPLNSSIPSAVDTFRSNTTSTTTTTTTIIGPTSNQLPSTSSVTVNDPYKSAFSKKFSEFESTVTSLREEMRRFTQHVPSNQMISLPINDFQRRNYPTSLSSQPFSLPWANGLPISKPAAYTPSNSSLLDSDNSVFSVPDGFDGDLARYLLNENSLTFDSITQIRFDDTPQPDSITHKSAASSLFLLGQH